MSTLLGDCFDERYRGCLSHRRYPDVSVGRRVAESISGNPYVRDRLRIVLAADSHRRLRRTTQVFVGAEDARLTDRSIHSQIVAAIAVALAIHLGLNEELTEAIALSHDVGHSPFGHYGEKWISDKSGIHLDHRIFGCIILQHIENGGQGLNLTREVLEGIFHHSGHKDRQEYLALPDEYELVNIADKIAYLFEDPEDAIRLGITDLDIDDFLGRFGTDKQMRINNVICELIAESAKAQRISFVDEFGQKFWRLQNWMYKNFYHTLDQRRSFLGAHLELCWNYLSNESYFEGVNPALLLALMNDEEVFRLAKPLMNRHFPVDELPSLKLGITDMVDVLRTKTLDLENPYLNWDPK